MAKEKTIKYSDKDYALVELLSNHADGLTLAEINELTNLDFKPGSISAAIKKGLIVRIGDKDVPRIHSREVNVYELVTDELKNNADGKPFNYSDSEKTIMAILKDAAEPMTLAAIANAMGKETISSGAINGLVNKKGNVAAVGTRVVPVVGKANVGVYTVVADLPQSFLDTLDKAAE